MQSLKKFYFGKSKNPSLIGSVYIGSNKWHGGVLAPNGMIYFCPRDATQVLQLDPTTNTTSLIGKVYSTSGVWVGAVLAPNGKIYFVPYNATRILQLEKVETPNVIGSDALVPSPISGLPTSNYNKYYNKF